MNKDLDPPAGADDQPPSGRPRRPRAVALVNTAALLSTTALLAVTETKLPPFKGD
jgi:hypothetical protein